MYGKLPIKYWVLGQPGTVRVTVTVRDNLTGGPLADRPRTPSG